MTQKKFKNVHVLRQIRPYNSTTYGKGNGKQKLQTRLFWSYNFVFTNLLKNVADVHVVRRWIICAARIHLKNC